MFRVMHAFLGGSSWIMRVLTLQGLLQLSVGHCAQPAWQLAFPEDVIALNDLQCMIDTPQAMSGVTVCNFGGTCNQPSVMLRRVKVRLYLCIETLRCVISVAGTVFL